MKRLALGSMFNLVPRVFLLSNMAAVGEKTLAHSRSHVTDLSTESGNLFTMAAKIYISNIYFYIFSRATLNETLTTKYDGIQLLFNKTKVRTILDLCKRTAKFIDKLMEALQVFL